MADRTATIIYNLTGQTVETYPPEWAEGIPSSGACSVWEGTESMDNTAEFTPTVTIDSTSYAATSSSGYSQTNRRRFTCTSVTASGLVLGRQYLLENALGQRELAVARAVSSGVYVDFESDMAYDYEVTTGTLKGVRMVFTVDPTWVATEQNITGGTTAAFGNTSSLAVESLPTPPWKVVWSYKVNSVDRRHYTYMRLVRHIAKHGVTIEDLREYWPDLPLEEFLSVRGQQFGYAIEAAYDRVRIDMLTAGYQPDQFRDTEIIDELVRAKTFAIIGRMGIAPNGRDLGAWIEDATKDYETLFNRTINATLKPWIDTGAEGSIQRDAPRQFWFRR